MISKSNLIKTGLAVGCVVLNLTANHSPAYTLINMVLFLTGISYFKSKDFGIWAAGLLLMPVMIWKQGIIYPGLMTLVSAAGIFLLVNNRWPKPVSTSLVLVPLLLAVMSTNGIINPQEMWKTNFDREKLFMFQSDSKTGLLLTTKQFQTDLWRFGIPFPRSQKIHNFGISSLNVFFRNITDFLNPPNFYRQLFFANIYLVILGLFEVCKRKKTAVSICLAASGIIFLSIIGLSLHGSREATLYPLLPWILYLAGLGSLKANRNIYLTSLISQIIILGWR